MSAPKRYRKKPVVIEAMQFDGSFESTSALREWGCEFDSVWDPVPALLIWNSAEMCFVRCPIGHYVIKGVKGEFYPCDLEIFAETYEAVP